MAGVGRGEIAARKRESELENVPAPGRAKAAPHIARGAPPPGKAPLARPGGAIGEPPQVIHRLSDTHIDSLKAALRDLGDARRLLDFGRSA